MLFGGALAGPALALPITCLLVAVAALFAPRSAPASLPRGRRAVIRHALGGVAVPLPGARAVFALVPLGVGLGIPLALGLMPGSAVALVGAFGACTAGHCLLGEASRADWVTWQRRDTRPSIAESPVAWFALLSFWVLASALRFSTLDLTAALAAQAAVGPGVLGGPLLFSAVGVLCGPVGLIGRGARGGRPPRAPR